MTQTQERLIPTPTDLREAEWEFLNGALKETSHRQLALKRGLGATAQNVREVDMKRKEVSIAQLNPKDAF